MRRYKDIRPWFFTGASCGFGRKVALEALRRGDRIIATARSMESLQALAELDTERVAIAQLDITNPNDIASSVNVAKQRLGHIDNKNDHLLRLHP
jgi:NADP-dependent 3-hydroxy acid dehydrogenase YdfG